MPVDAGVGDLGREEDPQHQVAREEHVRGDAKREDLGALAAQLRIPPQHVVEQVVVVLQEEDLRGSGRDVVQEAEARHETGEGVSGVALLHQRLEGVVRRGQGGAGVERQLLPLEHGEKSRQHLL